MAWNEPGGNNNDPWGNKKNDSGPPDLDEVFRNLQKKLTGLFGSKGSSNSGGSGGVQLPGSFGPIGIVVGLVLLAAIWLLSGFYIIQPAERGVILQFGQYAKTTQPGLHWRIPWPVQALERVNVEQNRSVALQSQKVLTKDENIVEIDMVVQYNIKDAAEYLFNVQDPDGTLQQATDSALREVIGQTDMDPIITQGRSVIASSASVKIQEILDSYNTGVLVTTVNLERAQPPAEVQAAFSDAIKAREDEQRFINESEAYANEVIPRARGDAAIALEEAKAYRTQVLNAAQGEANRFEALLEEYAKAPEVTRERLYIESIESVLSSSSKVMVDVDGGNNLMYLPVDKLMGGAGAGGAGAVGSGAQSVIQQMQNSDRNQFTPSQSAIGVSRPDNSRSRSREAQ
jgi:membrane protease subunit HflK